MKNQTKLLIIAIFCSLLGFSQTEGSIRTLENSGINSYLINPNGRGQKVEGSPYIIKSFQLAKVQNITQNSLMRYNAAKDEFEFINSKGDTLALNRTEDFGDITFTNLKTHYLLKNFIDKSGNSVTGFLIELYKKNNFILFKRQKVNFNEAKVAKTSYDSNTPARYIPGKDTFFIENSDSGIKELMTNKKGILKMFPEKKIEIEAFFKQNDIDLEIEKDVIKLVDFLAQ